MVMRKVSAIHEAIAGDNIYMLENGKPKLLGVKIDKVAAWIKSAEKFNKLFALSILTATGRQHFEREQASQFFSLYESECEKMQEKQINRSADTNGI